MARKLKTAAPGPAVIGNVVEMGDVVCVDRGFGSDTRTQYRRCLLIEFATEDDVKRAIEMKRVEFTIFGG